MTENCSEIGRRKLLPWQFSVRGLVAFSTSVTIGLSCWVAEGDWFISALAVFSFWIVVGLVTQIRDIWAYSRSCDVLTSDERWGWRFALVWRVVVCFLIGVCFLLLLLVRFHFLAASDGQLVFYVSSRELWEAVLLCSIIVAIGGSLGLGRSAWQRLWSWGISTFRGFVAGSLFMILLESRLVFPYLVHLTIVNVLLAQPAKYEPDAVFASSSTRSNQFYDIATADALIIPILS